MGNPPNTGLFDDLIEHSGLDKNDAFIQSLQATPTGFRFVQRLLGGGCIVWLFFGFIIPFVMWVYPAHAPLGSTYFIISGMVLGWLALAFEALKSVTITAEPGRLSLERRLFYFPIRRQIALDSNGLEVYERGASANGMMVSYGLRPVGQGRSLHASLSHREADILKALIERVVLSNPHS